MNSSKSSLTLQNASLTNAQAKMEVLLRSARKSLDCFNKYIDEDHPPARHHSLVNSKLEAVERGEIKRLMLFLPPGSAKSTYGSVRFPAWYFGKHPDHVVLQTTHTTTLSESFGRRVRNMIAGEPYQAVFETRLSDDSQAAGRWGTK